MNAPIHPPPALYDYRFSAEPVAIMGRMRAFGTRVLCRAILSGDHYKGPIVLPYNASDAVAFQVLSVGAGVRVACEKMGEEPPQPGQHCDVRSVAADRVNAADPLGRYWLVDILDIAAVWDPVEADAPGLFEACAEMVARGAAFTAPAPSNGAVVLSAR